MKRLQAVAAHTIALCLPVALVQCARAPSADEIARRGYPPSSESTAPAGSAAQGVPTGTRGWTLGQEYPYHLKLVSTVAFGDQPSVIDFDLSGDLLVIPASVAEGVTTLFVAVRNGKIVSRTPDSQEQLSKVAEQVSATGCLFTLVNGRVSEMRVASDLSTLSVGIYRELGARLQFAPSSDGAERYESEEYDGTGKYTAEYARTDPEGLHYEKRKLRYAGVLGAPTNTPLGTTKIVPYVSVSEGSFTLSADGRPTDIKVHDEITVTGAQMPVRSKNSLLLTAGPPVPGQGHDFASIAAHLTRVAADEPYAGKTEVAALDAARIHGLTYAQVIERLMAFAAAHQNVLTGNGPSAADAMKNQPLVQELSGLFMALAAIFRQQPETIKRALTAIHSHSPVTNTLIDALGSSGSPVAHKVLTELSQSPKAAPDVQKRALMALVRTSSPSDTAIDTLQKRLVKKPFDEIALYGLGTYARRLRDAGDFKHADDIATQLKETLARAGSEISRVEVALGGIANCGCEDALPQVIPFLKDGTDGVRVQAVRALQSMMAPVVEPLLVKSMVEDPSSSVRLTAIESARNRPEPGDLLLQALSKVAATDIDPHVRYKGVDLLIQWLPKRADLRATLQAIAKNDGEPQIRSRAQTAR